MLTIVKRFASGANPRASTRSVRILRDWQGFGQANCATVGAFADGNGSMGETKIGPFGPCAHQINVNVDVDQKLR